MSRTLSHAPPSIQRARAFGVRPPKDRVWEWSTVACEAPDPERYILDFNSHSADRGVAYSRETSSRRDRRRDEKSRRAALRQVLHEAMHDPDSDRANAPVDIRIGFY